MMELDLGLQLHDGGASRTRLGPVKGSGSDQNVLMIKDIFDVTDVLLIQRHKAKAALEVIYKGLFTSFTFRRREEKKQSSYLIIP